MGGPGIPYGAGMGAPDVPPEQRHWFPPPTPTRPLRDAPWLVPPMGAINFGVQSNVSLVGPTTGILASRDTPDQFAGVIRELTYSINNVTLTTNVTFALRFNQSPVDGFVFNIFPKNAATDIIQFDPPTTIIRLPTGAAFDILVTVADAATYLVGGFMRGWWYDSMLDDQWNR